MESKQCEDLRACFTDVRPIHLYSDCHINIPIQQARHIILFKRNIIMTTGIKGLLAGCHDEAEFFMVETEGRS